MSIKGPSFGSSTPDPSPVPPKPKSNSQIGSNSSGKNLALAAGGGIVLFVAVAALVSSPSDTTTPVSSSPDTSSTVDPASTLWGSWAVDTGGGNYLGWSWNAGSEQEAKEGALDSCKKAGGVKCEVLNSFGNGYAAMASGGSKWFGVGAYSTAEEARNAALKGCKESDPNPDSCSIDKEFKF